MSDRMFDVDIEKAFWEVEWAVTYYADGTGDDKPGAALERLKRHIESADTTKGTK